MKLVLLAIILGILACPWCEAQSEDKGCVIELNITGNFLPDRIEPEVATLNGKDARDNYFAPGKYRLEIAQPGYFSISDEIAISEGQKVLRIERMMRAKPRRIQLKITHDVPPPENHSPYEITLAPVANPQDTKSVSDGDEIQPGVYLLKIQQTAYELVDERKYVWPAEEPFVIEEKLTAKKVRLGCNVVYDIDPPQDFPAYQVALINKELFCLHKMPLVKPGHYYLKMQQPGYRFKAPEEICIMPSEQIYVINAEGVAKPRPISFEVLYGSMLVNACQAINVATGKDITFQDRFFPGEELDCIVKFKRFKSMRVRVKMRPGEGPFWQGEKDYPIKINLEDPSCRLSYYKFATLCREQRSDNIAYPYVLYADTESIEEHHIECEKWPGNRWIWGIWADPNAKNLVVYAGYLFAQVNFEKIKVSKVKVYDIPKLTEIHISRLIEHLGYVARREERGDVAALDVLASLVSDPAKHAKLKAASIAGIRRLLEYVHSWKLADPQDQARCKTVIEALEGLAGAR